jgi:hypothetical protein
MATDTENVLSASEVSAGRSTVIQMSNEPARLRRQMSMIVGTER